MSRMALARPEWTVGSPYKRSRQVAFTGLGLIVEFTYSAKPHRGALWAL